MVELRQITITSKETGQVVHVQLYPSSGGVVLDLDDYGISVRDFPVPEDDEASLRWKP